MPAKAKIFLSCGQAKDTGEPAIAQAIASEIRDLGFDCYFAVVEQSLIGLRESIFRQLETAEYFVFVDFTREILPAKDASPALCRGSLFSHQELAIASYLELPCLVFQESGVKTRDGMLSCFHVNPVQFSNRADLPKLVGSEILAKTQANEWQCDWKNVLSLHAATKPFGDATQGVGGPVFRYFHLSMRNNHRSKLALNSYAVLESIQVVDHAGQPSIDSIELKLAGSTLPNVFVAPKSSRRFDALRIAHSQPTVVQFVIPWCDSTEFHPHFGGVGRYVITYSFTSSNFPTVRRSFELNLTGNLGTTDLQEL